MKVNQIGHVPGPEEIRDFISARLAARLEVRVEELDPETPFSQYGLDSRNALRLSGELEEWLGRELPPTLVWDYPTIEDLARHLAGELHQEMAAPAAI